MAMINKNHWFVGENEISIALMRFYVVIEITKNDENVFYRLRVYKDGQVALVFNFNSLEEAVRFTEEDIDKCYTTDEIISIYKEDYANRPFLCMNTIDDMEVIDNKINLTSDQVKQAILSYFSKGKNYKMSVDYELEMSGDQLDICFYIIEHIGKDIKTRLTTGDLRIVFEKYLENTNYELDGFKYIGGIHRVGYFFDEDKPHFDGIELRVKEKEKSNVLKKHK